MSTLGRAICKAGGHKVRRNNNRRASEVLTAGPYAPTDRACPELETHLKRFVWA